MANLQQRIDLMVRLGDYFLTQPNTWKEAIALENVHNAWFTPEYSQSAAEQIGKYFLSADRLNEWIEQYPKINQGEPGQVKVGLVMAGNIPLVAFHDFLCAYLSGHQLLIKLSSKDRVLWNHLLQVLAEWQVDFAEQVSVAEQLKACDVYIATGSNNTARYFEQYFAQYPHIIRRNRTSVAILDGTESTEQLASLADDVAQYFGLGCRNVTKLYVPNGYDFNPLLGALSRYDHHMDLHKYKNNYDYQLTLFLLNKTPYQTKGQILLAPNESHFAPISVLHYEHYENTETLLTALQQDVQIQCIVGKGLIDFGNSQRPELNDYADGVDTMAFLTNL